MLSKEKIRLMASLAIYQKNGGMEDYGIAQHYRHEYVQSQLFSSAIRYSLCFLLGIGCYFLINTNAFFTRINTDGFLLTLRYYGLIYLAGLILYLLIALLVYIPRYNRAAKNTSIYMTGLKRLKRRFHTGE